MMMKIVRLRWEDTRPDERIRKLQEKKKPICQLGPANMWVEG